MIDNYQRKDIELVAKLKLASYDTKYFSCRQNCHTDCKSVGLAQLLRNNNHKVCS